MSTKVPSESTILDYIDNISVPGDVFSEPANEYWALVYLKDGLNFLNRQVIEYETQINKQYDYSKIELFCSGNAPLLRNIPKSLLRCAFDWYANSAYQYVRTIGMITYKEASQVKKYVETVIPDVLSYRDKIAAHFAWTKNDSRDNKAERKISITPQITFQDGYFFVGSWKLTSKSGKEISSSEAIKPWSLTKTHKYLCYRYWR